MGRFSFGLISLAVWLSAAAAERDDTYLPDGIENPNLNEPMYWRDAYNVLQDIDRFDKLYVQFHSCVWSEYYGDDEGGGGGDESDTWYLNSVPPFRANVAFSLYGVLSGYRDRGCARKTYINSFYSTGGVESYTNALALAGISGFSYVQDEGGDENGNYATTSQCNGGDEHDRSLGEDGDVGNGVKYDYGAYSYGLACSGDEFVSLQFSGEECDGGDVVALTDTLESYNENMKDSGCVEIYNSKTSSYAYGYDDDGVVGSVSLLQQSRACSPNDLSGKCPDPYGKAKQYAKAVECATGSIYCSSFKHSSYVLFFSVGGYMVLLAFFLIIREALLEYFRRRYDNDDTPAITKSSSKRDKRKSRKNREDKVEKARSSKSRRRREEKDKGLTKSPSKSRSISRSISKSMSRSRSPSKSRMEHGEIEKSPSSPRSERRKRRSKDPKSPKSPRSSKSKTESTPSFFNLIPSETASNEEDTEIKQSRSKSKSEKSPSRRRSSRSAGKSSPRRERSSRKAPSSPSPERHSSSMSPERASIPKSPSKTRSPRSSKTSSRKSRSSKSPRRAPPAPPSPGKEPKEQATRSKDQREDPGDDSLVRRLREKMEEMENLINTVEGDAPAPVQSIDVKDGDTASSLALPSLLPQEEQDYHRLTPPRSRKDVWASAVVDNAEQA